MIVVDASVAIAFLFADDSHHDAAVEAIAAVVGPLSIHPITLAEALAYPTRAGRANEAMAALRAVGIDVVPVDIDALRLAELRVATGCKQPDCCVLALAQHLNAAVLTFDDRLGRAAAALTG